MDANNQHEKADNDTGCPQRGTSEDSTAEAAVTPRVVITRVKGVSALQLAVTWACSTKQPLCWLTKSANPCWNNVTCHSYQVSSTWMARM